MGQRRVTSHDVAKLAGVSRTTVSLVLNRSHAVTLAQETRERVMQAAADLGYTPNSAARMLVRGNTETIGLVISDPALIPYDGFIAQVMHGIAEVNREHGYHVLLEGLTQVLSGNAYDALVDSRRIDGLIVLNPRGDDAGLLSLIERGFPVVLVGSVRHAQEYSVNYSSRTGIAAAARHLADLRHERIGMITFAPLNFIAADARLRAVRLALQGHGLGLEEPFVAQGNFSAESGFAAAFKLLTDHPDVTAIFAGNDTIAMGVISAAIALGRKVPEDLSIIGFDDLPFAQWLNPSLTTIRVDAVHQGALAAKMLIALLTDQAISERHIRLETEFITRRSTAPREFRQ